MYKCTCGCTCGVQLYMNMCACGISYIFLFDYICVGAGGRCPSVDQCCISVVVGKRGGGGIRTFQYSTLSKYIPLIAGTLSNQIAYDVYNVHPTNA